MVCTANLCRSPMAAALLGRHLDDAGVAASVRSAGLLGEGSPATAQGVATMAARGLDTTGHRSRRLGPGDLAEADLVLGLAREHVREAALVLPSAWPRTFTLKELVRRGEQAGPRPPGQDLAEWLAGLHAGRQRADLLGDSPADDVADPMGGTPGAYRATADELDDLVRRVVDLAWTGAAAGGPSGAARDASGTGRDASGTGVGAEWSKPQEQGARR